MQNKIKDLCLHCDVRNKKSVKNAFNPTIDTTDTEINMLTRAGMMPNPTMPMNKPDVGIETLSPFPDISNLMAQRPTSGYETEETRKAKDAALEEFYKENPEFRPPDQSGINQLQFIV